MNNKLIKFNLGQRNDNNIPDIKSGDIVKVHRKIKEGDKERIQVFEGIIIAVKGKQSSSPTITVRKVSNGVGVELVLPIYSPNIDKIELVKRAKVRRSKLYYIRNKSAKSMRLKYKDMADFAKVAEEKNTSDDDNDNVSSNKKEKEDSTTSNSATSKTKIKTDDKEDNKNKESKENSSKKDSEKK
ncbi:MAG TPA: 50S ribosomal protein L19 [Candidatus Moranbacteria bacterium]|nr:50S ribosomal protein L19 [Candidatus Moranbacteria bacterium]